ncbi:hypothetical protein IJG27_03335 [Candidatus Saccharibacteria bacterium]|nr:hypothetical protein [Candidatus Saccharibacteria bacterium]
MKKTHKKILGFTGLGLVAAVTTFAATTQVPGAYALSSTSDQLQVQVLSADPEVSVTSTSGSVVTSPDYSFTVSYNNVSNLKATLVNRNADGTVTWEEDLFDEAVTSPGEKTVNLNLDNYNGKGDFTITVTGTNRDGVPVEKIITVSYQDVAPAPIEPEDDKPTVDPDVPEAVTKTVEINIYDDTGALVKHYNFTDPSAVESLDLMAPPDPIYDGIYTMETITRDKNGNITDIKTTTIVIGDGYNTPVEIEDQGQEIDHVIITVKNSNGDVVIPPQTFPNPTPGTTVPIDLTDLPSGVYTIITDYYNSDDEKIATTTQTITKTEDGQMDVDIVQKVDTVTTVEIYIYGPNGNLVRIVRADRATGKVSVYDADENLLFTLDNAYSDDNMVIPMEGLAYGDYTGLIMYRNAEGKLVGDSKPIIIHYYEQSIVVPDTGSFFQGLNMTREDYLITGLVVFVVIGTVAFWIVKRNRKNNR